MLKDAVETRENIIQWIRLYFEENGPECTAVIGISGGKDSSIVAALCAKALGNDRVLGVLMPNGRQSDIADSRRLVDYLHIPSITVNIQDACNILRNRIQSAMPNWRKKQAEINLPPRLRMATLYYVAQSLPNGGRVANTCNRSEDYIGYSTKFGDSAGDFSPLANLMVHEVKQLGYALKLPKDLVDKTPADGVCGKTDEDNLGFTYDMLDNFIMYGTSGYQSVDVEIAEKHACNLHKLRQMPSFPLSFPLGIL